MRGERPYALLVDDVRKDGRERAYDWHMQVPDDVEFLPRADGSALLVERGEEPTHDRPRAGSRRLLVLPLGGAGATIRLEEYVSGVSRGRAHRARRLILTRRGTEARFRVALFPFRTTLRPDGPSSREEWSRWPLGAVVPAVARISGGVALELGDRRDEWVFTPGPGGRSRVRLVRDGRAWTVD